MKLSELKGKFGLNMERDGEFDSLGILSRPKKKMIVFVESSKFCSLLKDKNVSCVICPPSLIKEVPSGLGVMVSDKPRNSFYDLHNHLVSVGFYSVSVKKFIAKTAKIDKNAYIAESNVHIGENTIIEPNVTVHPNCFIGDNVVIRSGSVIGSIGFVFLRGEKNILIHPGGGVKIEDGVEIQSNCCVDKAVFGGYTILGKETKLDNFVHVAHDVIIGDGSLIAAGAVISGAVNIGKRVWVGPGAVISSEIDIGDKASITIGSVVVKSVKDNQKVSGNFAVDHNKFLRHLIKNSLF